MSEPEDDEEEIFDALLNEIDGLPDLPEGGIPEEELIEATASVMALQRERLLVPERLILAEIVPAGEPCSGALRPTEGSLCPFREFLKECGMPEAEYDLVCCKGGAGEFEECARYHGDKKIGDKFQVVCAPEFVEEKPDNEKKGES